MSSNLGECSSLPLYEEAGKQEVTTDSKKNVGPRGLGSLRPMGNCWAAVPAERSLACCIDTYSAWIYETEGVTSGNQAYQVDNLQNVRVFDQKDILHCFIMFCSISHMHSVHGLYMHMIECTC